MSTSARVMPSLRRYRAVHRSGSGWSLTPLTPISTTLVAPVSIVGDAASSGAVFTIQFATLMSATAYAFAFMNSSGAVLFSEQSDGGLHLNDGGAGYEMRAFHAKGDTAYAAIVATSQTLCIPYFELPDAGSGSGRGKMTGANGAPASGTVGSSFAASVGDFSWRKRTASATDVLYACTTAGSPGTWTQVI